MEKWLLYKRTFHASHKLECHKGKCRALHGHTYRLKICLRPAMGSFLHKLKDCHTMITDFGDLRATVDRAIGDYDHANLNDLMPEPTVEAFAGEIWKAVSAQTLEIRWLELWETDTCGVFLDSIQRYTGGGKG